MPTARAVRIQKPGGPEVLALGELEVADPGPAEVLVAVAAAGLNRADCLQRRGYYPAPAGFPAEVPGLEFAGVVDTVGPGVTEWKAGDRVMGITGGGGMATHIVAAARELLPVPATLSLEEAAAVPEAFLTAYDALFLQGGVTMGRDVLIHSVASGVGTAALQLVEAAGARAIGTSRSPEKLERCAELGLREGIRVEGGRFAEAVRSVAPGGADAVLDTVGAAYLGENVACLAKGGRIVVIGLLGGAKGELPLGALLAKRGTLIGTVLRSRPPEEKAQLTQAFRASALPFLASGRLRPVVETVLPMDEIGRAHARMDANETFGKIVLSWG